MRGSSLDTSSSNVTSTQFTAAPAIVTHMFRLDQGVLAINYPASFSFSTPHLFTDLCRLSSASRATAASISIYTLLVAVSLGSYGISRPFPQYGNFLCPLRCVTSSAVSAFAWTRYGQLLPCVDLH